MLRGRNKPRPYSYYTETNFEGTESFMYRGGNKDVAYFSQAFKY